MELYVLYIIKLLCFVFVVLVSMHIPLFLCDALPYVSLVFSLSCLNLNVSVCLYFMSYVYTFVCNVSNCVSLPMDLACLRITLWTYEYCPTDHTPFSSVHTF